MAKLKIQAGTKLEIAFERRDKNILRSTFEKNVTDISFLVSAPIKDGKYVEPDCSEKLIIRFPTNGSTYIVMGYVDDTVKVGVRNYWKIRKISEEHEFFQRADKRYDITLRVKFTKAIWNPDDLDSLEKMDGATLDISAGGLAFFANTELRVGEVINMYFPTVGNGQPFVQRAEACWVRDAGKGTLFKYLVGLRFIFDFEIDKNDMMKYISNVVMQNVK